MTELDKFLKYRCLKGLQERGFADNSEYQERLQYELDVIASMGFSGYFLIVQDFVVWAKNNNILVGCARGSAGGCLLSYCLRITELDPIKYDLLFERFMNPDRISMPDIDIDFPNRKRHLVLEYICQKYGEGNVAHIGTFGTLKSKSAVKDVARTLGEPIPLAEKICKLLLAPISGKPQPIAESIKQVPKIKAMAESDSAEGTVIRWAQKVENLKKSMGVHACLAGNTKILTKSGIQQIKDINHCELKTSWRWQPAVCFPSGKKKVYRLHVSKSKFSSKRNYIDLTTDHKVLTKEHDWIQAGDCIGSTALCEPPNLNAWKYATLAGWIWNDGYVNKDSSKIYFTPEKDQEAIDYLSKFLLSQDKKREDKFGISKEHTAIIASSFGSGLRTNTPDKRPPNIPPAEFPQGLKLAWLRGFMSANASVQRGTIRLKLTSRRMIDYVKRLLATLDLETTEPSYCRGKQVTFPNGEYQCKDSWQIEMSINPSWRFKNLIGFIQTYKNDGIPDQQFQKLEYLGEQEVYDFTVDTDNDTERNTYANGILVHNCGIVISNEPLESTVPLFKGRSGELTTQWEMGNIEDSGLIKFDNLGVEALDKIEICLELIKERYDRTIDVDNLPLDDELVFSELRQGNTMGIFQMEGSAGIRDLLVKVKPSSIEDIIATTCLFRPGPLSSGYADIYVDVKNGIREPEYIVPELEPILGNTHSVFIYQEQIMNIAKKLCGYTGGQADELRKAIGKKKQKLMDKHEKLFKDGWVKNGYPAAGANKLWDDINNCASYLFNRTVDKDTKVITIDGIKRIEDCSFNDTVYTLNPAGNVVKSKVIALYDHGIVPLWEVEFDDGTVEKCTLDHKWLTEWGQQPLWQILEMDCEVWGSIRYKKEDVCASETMPGVLQSTTQEKRLGLPRVSADISYQEIINGPQKKLQAVYSNSEWRKVRSKRENFSLRIKEGDVQTRSQESQTKLSGMSTDTSRNQSEDSKICSLHTETSPTKIRSCQTNFRKTRNMCISGSSFGLLAFRKSRETSRELEEGLCQSQEVQNGSMVGTPSTQIWFQTERTVSLRGRTQTGGFYQQREADNPRGGWTVALSAGTWRRSTTENSVQGQNAREGSLETSDLEAGKNFNGELQNLRRTYEAKRREPIRYLDKWGQPTYSMHRKVVRISYIGMQQGYDLEVDHPDHNFLLASGLCCSNSHGAGYSMITYQTAYLKVHYPTEYLCAVMLVLGGKKKDHLIKCLTECKRLGIQVLPPDINESKKSFSVTNDKQIRFGLGPIKNVGAGANTVLEERRIGGPFSSLRNFCERVDMSTINRLKLESLIKAGCFDRFGQNRATMLAAVEGIWEYRDEIKRYESKVETYKRKEKLREDRLREIEEGLTNKKPLKPWPIPEEPRWPEVVEMDELNDTETHSMEHDLLGFFVSSHPLDNIDIKGLSTIEEMEDMGNGQEVTFAGVVTSLKEITTKVKKKKMGFALVEDLTGSLEVTIFSTVYSRISHLLESTSPIQIRGNVDVTEADEGDKTTKVRVKDVTLLDFRRKTDEPEILDVCVPITRAAELVQLLDKYAGDQHEVRVATTLQDGTKIRYPIQPFIGKHRGVFMKEVARISDGTKER